MTRRKLGKRKLKMTEKDRKYKEEEGCTAGKRGNREMERRQEPRRKYQNKIQIT